MSYNPDHLQIMKPLLLAKEEPDCDAGDHVSESNFDDGRHSVSYKSSQMNSNSATRDIDSDNEASNDLDHHSHSLSHHHHHRSGIKLEAALLELNEGLNLISKPNSNTNDDNNNSSYNSATTSNNDSNNNNTNNAVKSESNNNNNNNKTPRKLFECDVCNVSYFFLSVFCLCVCMSVCLAYFTFHFYFVVFVLLDFIFCISFIFSIQIFNKRTNLNLCHTLISSGLWLHSRK